MFSLVAVAPSCAWSVGVQLQIHVPSDLAVKADIVETSWHRPTLQDSSAQNGCRGNTICPQTRGKNQLQMQLGQTATGAAVDQPLNLGFNAHLSLARSYLPTFLIIYLGWPFSEHPPTKPCHFLPLLPCS